LVSGKRSGEGLYRFVLIFVTTQMKGYIVAGVIGLLIGLPIGAIIIESLILSKSTRLDALFTKLDAMFRKIENSLR
jgi:hypothetical protein